MMSISDVDMQKQSGRNNGMLPASADRCSAHNMGVCIVPARCEGICPGHVLLPQHRLPIYSIAFTYPLPLTFVLAG